MVPRSIAPGRISSGGVLLGQSKVSKSKVKSHLEIRADTELSLRKSASYSLSHFYFDFDYGLTRGLRTFDFLTFDFRLRSDGLSTMS